MIVRMWETRVKPGMADELIAYVHREVWPSLNEAAGFLGGEMLRSHRNAEERVLLVTRWADEAAIAGFLGPDWAAREMTPVPDEADFVDGVPFVDHWIAVQA